MPVVETRWTNASRSFDRGKRPAWYRVAPAVSTFCSDTDASKAGTMSFTLACRPPASGRAYALIGAAARKSAWALSSQLGDLMATDPGRHHPYANPEPCEHVDQCVGAEEHSTVAQQR